MKMKREKMIFRKIFPLIGLVLVCLFLSSAQSYEEIGSTCNTVQIPQSYKTRVSILTERYNIPPNEAEKIAKDPQTFAQEICRRKKLALMARNINLRQPKTVVQQQNRQTKLQAQALPYSLAMNLTEEQIKVLKKRAMDYQKWITEPLVKKQGRTRFVLATTNPIPIKCSVGYDTVVILPFKIEKDSLVNGDPSAFRVSVFGDRTAIKISPLKPFRSTSIIAKALDPKEFPLGVLAFQVEETMDQPQVDFVVWVIDGEKIKKPTETQLAQFAIYKDRSYLPLRYAQVANPICQSPQGLPEFVARICDTGPFKERLYVIDGSGTCFGEGCQFEVILNKKTVIGVKGHAKICSKGNCFRVSSN